MYKVALRTHEEHVKKLATKADRIKEKREKLRQSHAKGALEPVTSEGSTDSRPEKRSKQAVSSCVIHIHDPGLRPKFHIIAQGL